MSYSGYIGYSQCVQLSVILDITKYYSHTDIGDLNLQKRYGLCQKYKFAS